MILELSFLYCSIQCKPLEENKQILYERNLFFHLVNTVVPHFVVSLLLFYFFYYLLLGLDQSIEIFSIKGACLANASCFNISHPSCL